MPRLVDTVLADAFRDGRDTERRLLEGVSRADVLARMHKCQDELDFIDRHVERLRGRLSADNDWLTENPEEL